MANVVANLLYSKEHEWVEVIGEGRVRVGITDFAQHQLGDLVFVDLPQVGAAVTADDSMGSVESVKAVSDIFSPVTGTVVEVNPVLEDEPETINSDPFQGGWMVVVALSNPDELNGLMNAEQYAAFTEE
ncbi:glycine cleavage system protein GcvH [Brevibacillus fluminis]|uniref:glycine cleavage system protein GcvH n=1 Tax=Brevibacillus fluminis TaxID=511487 RepID=UPI003F8A92D8